MVAELQLSALQQKDVWEGWIGAEVRANYFADLSGRSQTEQKVLTWLTLLFSSGAVTALLATSLPPEYQWMRLAFALLAAAISVFSLVQQNQKRSTDYADLHFRWNRLADQYKALWGDMYSPDAPNTLHELEEKEADLSKSSTSFPNNKRSMDKWQDYVQQQHRLTSVA